MTQIKCPICGRDEYYYEFVTAAGVKFSDCRQCFIMGPSDTLSVIGKLFSDYIDEEGNVTGRMFWDGTKWINVWGSGGE